MTRSNECHFHQLREQKESVQCEHFVLSLYLRPIFNAQVSSEIPPAKRQCTQSATSEIVPTFFTSVRFRRMVDDLKREIRLNNI